MESQPQQSPHDAVQSIPAVKVFLEYSALMQKLIDRGMSVNNRERCERKLAQVGYYRLSGYWHSARSFTRTDGAIIYNNQFQQNTSFEAIFDFYRFDKSIRQEFMAAIERIEIYFRTIIAHELGRISPLAYENKSLFAANVFDTKKKGPNFADWTARHQRLLEDCKEDSITSHFLNNKPIPIWVAVEAWDFGLMSKFYSMLKDEYRDLICQRAGINNREVLDNWLININGLRNRCAHHSRFCNRPNPRRFKTLRNGYFNLLGMSPHESDKLFGAVAVIWYLLKKIGPSSKWLMRIAELIDTKPAVPGFHFNSMGFARDLTAFPRERFQHEFAMQPVSTGDDEAENEQDFTEALLHRLEKIAELSPTDEMTVTDRLLQLAEYHENIKL